MAAWTQDQVLALAPDPASAKAGKDLANPRKKWSTLGRAEGVIWGECQGSGSRPYQTQVDLNGPGFGCSCPSRKFPCKHGLGLLLMFAADESALAESCPPAWVSAWLEGRTKRAEQKAAKEQAKHEKIERGESVVDDAARLKREAARASKVAAGIEELVLWITDLLQRGLASLQSQSGNTWEERARRLIDAQAPGLARQVQRLGDLPLTGNNWQASILERLSRIHLLTRAYRRLDVLPPESREDVRAAIGFTADQDHVRADPGVRDHWQVVGVAVEIEERLRVQRTWLVGRSTGRPALLLDFTHLAQPRTDAGLPVGTEIEAELAFFPSNWPLRALLKQRLNDGTRLLDPSGPDSIAQARAAFSEGLARQPWLPLFPFVLRQVVVWRRQDRWVVRDAAGVCLPLSPRFRNGWELLAFSGGHPITLSGEFDGSSLTPLAAWAGEAFRSLPISDEEAHALPPAPLVGPANLVAAWQEATTSALVGIERRGAVALPAELAEVGRPLEQRAAGDRLLETAALVSLYVRVGQQLAADPTAAPAPCGPEERPPCTPASTWRLRQILDGDKSLIPEWFEWLGTRDQRVPDELLVDVLNLGRSVSALRPAIVRALGRRGRWLAAQNPEWDFVGGESDRVDPHATWQTGSRAERRGALAALRAADPEAARVLLASTWNSEPADERAEFVEVLATGLSDLDEEFLETRLDDKSKVVRRNVANLLAQLPTSGLVARMAERARLRIQRSPDGLVVIPPDSCPADWVRDGIEPKVTSEATACQLGEKAWWLAQAVSFTPPESWTKWLGMPMHDLVEAGMQGEWARALLWGWGMAAIRNRDAAWAGALLERPLLPPSHADVLRRLLALLPGPRRERLLVELLERQPGSLESNHPVAWLFTAPTGLFGALERPIGPALLRVVIERARAATQANKPTYDYVLPSLLTAIGHLASPGLIDEIERVWPGHESAPGHLASQIQEVKATLQFRRDMHQEFAR